MLSKCSNKDYKLGRQLFLKFQGTWSVIIELFITNDRLKTS